MFFLKKRPNRLSLSECKQHSNSYFPEIVFVERAENSRIEESISDAVPHFGIRNDLRSI